MSIKWIGALLVMTGCGGFGFAMAASHRREERNLSQLIRALEYMRCDLTCRMTPLPQLCRHASRSADGVISAVLELLARELEMQLAPDARACMASALSQIAVLSPALAGLLGELGATLGEFDLPGQLRGIDMTIESARRELEALSENRTHRLRSYQTLGLCAGAALAILFI